MPDEKRIKDFEPATELLIDDWFAVDSPSQGTRKMQASMFQEGLQTQITTNTENIALHSGQISVLQQGVGNIGDKVDVLGAAVTVEAYSASKLYAVGEDCVYEGVRYKCITAIETPEAFDPNKWQAISIEGELNELNSSLTNIQSVSAQFLVSNLQASSGIYAYKLGKILFVSGYINSTQSLSRGVEIARISVNPFFETFDGPVNNTLTKGGRFVLRTSGILQTEETIDANQWYSFSFVTLIR